MNELSIIIYFAGMVGEIKSFCFVVFWGVICWMILVAMVKEKFIYNKYHLQIIVLVMVIDIFIPNKDTLYAIASSEFGEELLKSKVSGKAQLALEKWISDKLD